MDLAPLVQRLKDEIDNDWKQVTGFEIEEAEDRGSGYVGYSCAVAIRLSIQESQQGTVLTSGTFLRASSVTLCGRTSWV